LRAEENDGNSNSAWPDLSAISLCTRARLLALSSHAVPARMHAPHTSVRSRPPFHPRSYSCHVHPTAPRHRCLLCASTAAVEPPEPRRTPPVRPSSLVSVPTIFPFPSLSGVTAVRPCPFLPTSPRRSSSKPSPSAAGESPFSFLHHRAQPARQARAQPPPPRPCPAPWRSR
jgi:hypothetical protein